VKVVAINGSPKTDGNTFQALSLVAAELSCAGIETEILQVGSQEVRGCIACGQCAKNRNERCVLPGDQLNQWVQKMKEADGIVLGSPVYYSGIAGTMKSFLDRAFYVSGANGGLFRHKVGAALVAVRRSGGLPTFQQLNNYLLYSEMLLPTSNYWNVIHGTRPGEVHQDSEGTQIMRVLGKNMAWLLKLVEHGRGAVPEPEQEPKTYFNFIH